MVVKFLALLTISLRRPKPGFSGHIQAGARFQAFFMSKHVQQSATKEEVSMKGHRHLTIVIKLGTPVMALSSGLLTDIHALQDQAR